MKTVVLASAVALGLSTVGALAATPSFHAMPATGGQSVQQSTTTGTTGAGFSAYATHTLPDPTGQTEYGPHGEISLWAPDPWQ
jgi:hypothetical protein